jgi:hypothetical protein
MSRIRAAGIQVGLRPFPPIMEGSLRMTAKNPKKPRSREVSIVLGSGFGAAIGAVVGTYTGEMAQAVALGVCFGTAIGCLYAWWNSRRDPTGE